MVRVGAAIAHRLEDHSSMVAPARRVRRTAECPQEVGGPRVARTMAAVVRLPARGTAVVPRGNGGVGSSEPRIAENPEFEGIACGSSSHRCERSAPDYENAEVRCGDLDDVQGRQDRPTR